MSLANILMFYLANNDFKPIEFKNKYEKNQIISLCLKYEPVHNIWFLPNKPKRITQFGVNKVRTSLKIVKIDGNDNVWWKKIL